MNWPNTPAEEAARLLAGKTFDRDGSPIMQFAVHAPAPLSAGVPDPMPMGRVVTVTARWIEQWSSSGGGRHLDGERMHRELAEAVRMAREAIEKRARALESK